MIFSKTHNPVLTFTPFKVLLIGVLIACSNFLSAQDTCGIGIFLKFHPLPALNVGIPRLQGSVEFRLKEKFGIELGYGKRYIDKNFWIDEKIDTSTIQSSGDIKMIDLNYYNFFQKLHKKKRNFLLENYLGFSYRQIRDTRNKMTEYWPDTSGVMHTDCYAIKRTVFVYAVKFGIAISYKKIGAEAFGELGIRYKNQYLINSEMDLKRDGYPNGFWFWDVPYEGILPHINVGIKLNYKIL